MSKKHSEGSATELSDVRVEGRGLKEKNRRHTHDQIYEAQKGIAPKVSSMSSDFAYVNPAYVGSVNSVSEGRATALPAPPTSVIREQYWTCSKWPFAQRVLVIAVGVLLGAVVGLAITMGLPNDKDRGGLGIFRSHPAPD